MNQQKEKKKIHFLKTIFNHSLICQFQLIIISITFQSILIQSLSLSLWMKTQTHTQLINIYHTNHHQSISSTTTIHVHSFSFHKQHTQSLSQNNHFSSHSSKSISSSLLSHSSHSIQQCDSINNILSFISLIMSELSQVF